MEGLLVSRGTGVGAGCTAIGVRPGPGAGGRERITEAMATSTTLAPTTAAVADLRRLERMASRQVPGP